MLPRCLDAPLGHLLFLFLPLPVLLRSHSSALHPCAPAAFPAVLHLWNPVCMFLWLTSLCGAVACRFMGTAGLSVCIAESHSVVWIHHGLLIHSPVDRHLDVGVICTVGSPQVSCYPPVFRRLCMDMRFHFSWVDVHRWGDLAIWQGTLTTQVVAHLCSRVVRSSCPPAARGPLTVPQTCQHWHAESFSAPACSSKSLWF